MISNGILSCKYIKLHRCTSECMHNCTTCTTHVEKITKIHYCQSGDPFRGRPACELIAMMEMYVYADWGVTALIPCRGRTSCALLKSSGWGPPTHLKMYENV